MREGLSLLPWQFPACCNKGHARRREKHRKHAEPQISLVCTNGNILLLHLSYSICSSKCWITLLYCSCVFNLTQSKMYITYINLYMLLCVCVYFIDYYKNAHKQHQVKVKWSKLTYNNVDLCYTEHVSVSYLLIILNLNLTSYLWRSSWTCTTITPYAAVREPAGLRSTLSCLACK